MAMELDAEIVRLLISTFKVELEDQIQTMTACALELEKGLEGSERVQSLDRMFRAAHNIKGAARGVEVGDVAEIAHRLESLLALLRRGDRSLSPQMMDLCLQSFDRMRDAMAAYEAHRPVEFDLPALLAGLDAYAEAPGAAPGAATVAVQQPTLALRKSVV